MLKIQPGQSYCLYISCFLDSIGEDQSTQRNTTGEQKHWKGHIAVYVLDQIMTYQICIVNSIGSLISKRIVQKSLNDNPVQ